METIFIKEYPVESLDMSTVVTTCIEGEIHGKVCTETNRGMGLICLIGVSLIIFVAVRLTGDPTVLLLPEDAKEEDFEKLRAELGLDKPIPVQYLIFIREAAKGNFGRSVRWKRPAIEFVLSRIPATLQLGAFAFSSALLRASGGGDSRQNLGDRRWTWW